MGAAERGLGGCMFGSADKQGLRKDLRIPEEYEVLLVIALGKPKEKVVLEELREPNDVKYWRDENQVHHVPKKKIKGYNIGLTQGDGSFVLFLFRKRGHPRNSFPIFL